MSTTKFTRHGIIQDGIRYKAYISTSRDNSSACITADGYRGFRGLCMKDELSGLAVRDDTDTMTDYFCRPRIEIPANHPLIETLKKIEENGRIKDAKRKEQKLQKREKELASVEKKIKVRGVWYEIVSEGPHPNRENWTYYTIKKISARAQKLYAFTKSNDGKFYTEPWTVGTL